jgi:hypothetical protein
VRWGRARRELYRRSARIGESVVDVAERVVYAVVRRADRDRLAAGRPGLDLRRPGRRRPGCPRGQEALD